MLSSLHMYLRRILVFGIVITKSRDRVIFGPFSRFRLQTVNTSPLEEEEEAFLSYVHLNVIKLGGSNEL